MVAFTHAHVLHSCVHSACFLQPECSYLFVSTLSKTHKPLTYKPYIAISPLGHWLLTSQQRRLWTRHLVKSLEHLQGTTREGLNSTMSLIVTYPLWIFLPLFTWYHNPYCSSHVLVFTNNDFAGLKNNMDMLNKGVILLSHVFIMVV